MCTKLFGRIRYPSAPDSRRIEVSQRKVGNSHDPLAVAVIEQIDEHDTIVRRVSKRISASCNAFICRGT